MIVWISSGVIILNEYKKYTPDILFGIFLGVVISCIGIKIVLNKNAYLKTFGEDKEPGQEVETADEDEPKKNANFRDIAHM